mmetsp:Transcript_63855/g.125402  ORF Transcript_63855/g.125402 Transcript_63855/m.125402 type:complete len:255 (+) Transcript_63855:97-861(+)
MTYFYLVIALLLKATTSMADDEFLHVDAHKDYRPPPRVYKDMGDKYKHMPDKPNYPKKGKKKPKHPKPPSSEVDYEENMIGADGEPMTPEESAMLMLEKAEKNTKKQKREQKIVEKEMKKERDQEMQEIENDRERQSADAPREFERRIQRIQKQAKGAIFSPVELTSVQAEIEALEQDLPRPSDYTDSPMALSDLGIPSHAASSTLDRHLNPHEKERDAAKEKERDRMARLWALERTVLERSMGYKATAQRGEL